MDMVCHLGVESVRDEEHLGIADGTSRSERGAAELMEHVLVVESDQELVLGDEDPPSLPLGIRWIGLLPPGHDVAVF